MSASITTATSVTTFEFVVGDRPDQLKGGLSKRTRSHLSKQGWKAHFAQHEKQIASLPSSSISSGQVDETQTQQQQQQKNADERSQKKRRRRLQVAVTYELEVDEDGSHRAVVIRGTESSRLLISGDELVHAQALMPPIDRRFGGVRVDPFRSYPGPWKAYIPRLVDHYITHMAVDIPELDQPGNKGLLRTHWFRLATTDTSTFQVIMLLSAANIVTVKGGVAAELGFQMLQLKHEALAYINAAFRDNEKRLSDMLIGAVAKMASFEAMHGDVESFRLHMAGLKRMVGLRGGLSRLGLSGLLRRMIIWIDLNGGFLLNEPRYFPGQTFAGNEYEVPEPNPARFIAI